MKSLSEPLLQVQLQDSDPLAVSPLREFALDVLVRRLVPHRHFNWGEGESNTVGLITRAYIFNITITVSYRFIGKENAFRNQSDSQ